MAETIPGLIVKIGTRSSDAVGQNVAISDTTPFVSWNLPTGTRQGKFRVVIEYMEGDHVAVRTTEAHTREDRSYQFEPAEALDRTFNGLCRVYIELSESTAVGEFEFRSEDTYFVFDQFIERFVQADAVTLKWDRPSNPDNLPNVNPYFQVQISEVPRFTSNIVYNNAVIPATNASQQTLAIPSSQFIAGENKYYFYRVRMNDGLDWGDWSRTNAFISLSDAAPVLTIDDVVNTHNDFNDVLITFTVRGTGDWYSVSFLGSGANMGDSPVPLYLINPVVKFAPGTYTVTWRTCNDKTSNLPQAVPNQVGRQHATVTIQAVARDPQDTANTVTYGPFLLDNLYMPPGGGVPYRENTYPVALGKLVKKKQTVASPINKFPLGIEVRAGKDKLRFNRPVSLGKFVYTSSYVIGTLEPREQGTGMKGGFGTSFGGVNNRGVYWPQPMAMKNIYGGPDWDRPYGGFEETEKAIKVDNAKAFTFSQPYNFTNPTTLPAPFNSRYDEGWGRFLKGYIDLDGKEVEYPDEYDWNRRPSWHFGREVWGEDDAWIQIATYEITDAPKCDTCQGRGWIATGDKAPYLRTECPNARCFNGFDKSRIKIEEITDSRTQKKFKGVIAKWYIEPKWHRFSRWYGHKFPRIERFGMNLQLGRFAYNQLFVLGHSPSFRDAVYKEDTNHVPQLQRYEIEQPDGSLRIIDKSAELVHSTLSGSKTIVGRPFRQFESPRIKGFSYPGKRGSGGTVPTVHYPLEVDLIHSRLMKDNTPVQGKISSDKKQFYLGQGDPESDIYMGGRPKPTQPGSLRLVGNIGFNYHTQDTKIRFLQSWWDAYNTLHAQYSAGSGIQLHWQYAEANTTNWRDVKAENATFYPKAPNTNGQSGAWLTEAEGFHAFWNTMDPAQFVEGQSYKLRVRPVNLSKNVVQDFVEAPQPFTILHGVANPISVIGTVYDPWEKSVTVTFRIDDSQADAYSIRRLWWTKEKNDTNPDMPWNEIGLGDIAGETSYLSSKPGENIHTVKWLTAGSNLSAGNTFRIRVEGIPTGLTELITLPFFKWLSPRNPYVDQAELDLGDYLGRVETQYFDLDDNQWHAYNPPKYKPGQLWALQQEYERIKQDPTDVAPSGYYTFWQTAYDNSLPPLPTGEILVDPSGYNIWLNSKYVGSESHSRAMNRVATQMDSMTRVLIPRAQQAIIEGELVIRKTLIEQGYYAEGQFKYVNASGYREVVDAIPVSNVSGEEMPDSVERWWQFRVQSVALGGENVFKDGLYNPSETTELEQVWYKIQMDGFDTFDSQPFKKPLREFIFNHLGERLSVATFFAGEANTSNANPAVDGPQGTQVTDPQTGLPLPNQGSDSAAASANNVVVSGAIKLLPEVLPGEITAADINPYAVPPVYPPQVGRGQQPDVLPANSTTWNGSYLWRVAAYNKISGVVNAIPRPLVTGVAYTNGEFKVDYLSQGHEDFTTLSLKHYTTYWGELRVQGYMVSTEMLTQPQWVEMKVEPLMPFTWVDFVSDRRADSHDPTRKPNPNNWIPLGTNRPHPCWFYDDIKQQYVMFHTKRGFDGTNRVVSGRAMQPAVACEYGTYFQNEPAQGIFAPCVVYNPADSMYHIWVTKRSLSDTVYIQHSVSRDADTWETLTDIDGIPNGLKPSVSLLDGIWHMWYLRDNNGLQSVFYATSTDGISFEAQNDGNPVFTDGNRQIDKPCVVRVGTSWVMYFNDLQAGKIASVVSSDGVSWSSRQVELSAFNLVIEGTPTNVPVMNPCVFVDRWCGNRELVMVFNLLMPGGESRTAIARLETRQWSWGDETGNRSSNNHRIDVPVSRAGIPRTLYIDAPSNGLSAGDQPKVRLIVDSWTPTTKDYHRQSAWVDINNAADLDSYLSPDPYYYDEQVKGFNYLIQFKDIQ